MTDSGLRGTTGRPRGGRPRASSRRTLEDAATELFLEQGYAQTTIDQIAQHAGVGRNTFFNYFSAKRDLLWVDADETLGALPDVLADIPTELPPSAALEHAMTALAARHPRAAVPLALSQREPMATQEEFLAAGLPRFLAVAAALAEFLAARAPAGVEPLVVRAAANATLAAAATGAAAWGLSGVERGDLADDVHRSVAPVVAGFAPLLDAIPPAGTLDANDRDPAITGESSEERDLRRRAHGPGASDRR
ncbi:TetR/AcrR family transcriptional regulator [Agromyces sp. LHK192]|uniref:TetR/AcrR family transcriptional regulator n=1 Tax=Agromyces sp. LHK192 TaxID=2498704 RepID=UPI000FD9E661|nr:TetR/AcrR family transcriptional regulator [Agromyces sp. LHK192]